MTAALVFHDSKVQRSGGFFVLSLLIFFMKKLNAQKLTRPITSTR
jgi:hypothetical protein